MSAASTRQDTVLEGPQSWWQRLTRVLLDPDSPYVLAMLYLVALTLAEVVTVMMASQAGALIHLTMLFMLMVHTAVTWHKPIHRFLMGLTFVPLIRIISLSLPLTGFPLIYWYLITSIPLFAAVYVAGRQLDIPIFGGFPRLRELPLQLAIGATGIVLGVIEYAILRPDPLIEGHFRWDLFWLGALILFISTGYVEELIFRRIMQVTTTEQLGNILGIMYVSALFAVLHIGYKSLADVIFVFIVGFGFGLIVLRTGSLLGVSIAHGLTNTVLFLVVPFLVIGEMPLPEASSSDIRAWAEQTLDDIRPAHQELPTMAVPLTLSTTSALATATGPAVLTPTAEPSSVSELPAVVTTSTLTKQEKTVPTTRPSSSSSPTAGRFPTTTPEALIIASGAPAPTTAPTIAPSPAVVPATPSTGPKLDTIPVATGQYVTTTFDLLNLRLGPDVSYASLGFLVPDQTYELLGQNETGDWLLICCLEPGGQEGWVSAGFLTGDQVLAKSTPITTPTQSISTPVAMVVVSVERLAVRASPDFDSLTISEQSFGTSFEVIARTPAKDWFFICCVEGDKGWVYAKSVTLSVEPFSIPVFVEPSPAPFVEPPPAPDIISRMSSAGQPKACQPPAVDESGVLAAIASFFESLVEIVFPSDDSCR